MKFSFSIFANILCITGLVYADLPLSIDFKVYETYVDNIFQTSNPDFDYVTLLYINLDYAIKQNISMVYNSNINLFYKYTDLHNQSHFLSLEHEKDLLQCKGKLYLGAGIGLNDNRRLYSNYDNNIVGTYAGFRYYFTELTYGQIEYQIDFNNYPEYSIYDSIENYCYLQLSKSIQASRTSIQTRVDLGRRNYTDYIKNYIDQVTGSIKIAQSFTDTTGLQLKYSKHHASSFPFEDSFIQDYYTNEFEDDYNYSGREISLTLKQIAPWSLLIKGSFARKSKIFNVLYLDEQARKDNNTDIMLEIEKDFSAFNGLSLHLQFLHRKNNSNDKYYDSSTSIFSTGMKITF